MHNEEEQFDEFEATPPAAASAGSLRERIQAKRAATLADNETEIDIPGYHGDLVARYRLMSTDELAAREKHVSKQEKKIGARAHLYGKAATISDACVGVYGRDDGQLVKVAEGYTKDLAEFTARDGQDVSHLQTPGSIARFVIPREVAVGVHYGELMTWMAEGNEEADDELLGESTAASS